MQINDITGFLETLAPTALQETYDNCGLLVGVGTNTCTGLVISLDATEEVVMEAIEKNCNLIVSHHPVIFSGLKKLNGKNYVEKTVMAAIKNDVAIYAIHTNLDNVLHGVNSKMADKLGLKSRRVLAPGRRTLKKLFTYVPASHLSSLRDAIFEAGGGNIGNYSACSFTTPGIGSFKGRPGTDPFTGKPGEMQYEPEQKLEIIFEGWKESSILHALIKNHPYEEVAYEIISLDNAYQNTGSGLIGEWETGMDEMDVVELLKNQFGLKMVRHTALTGKKIKTVALCGGAGSFLIPAAMEAGAGIFITADIKYHEFFEANGKLVIADIGHWESEQFTIGLLAEELQQKFPTFAVLKTGVNTNPVYYG
jgi:dinuclear metal center YbgI/SA1388 family protein